MNSTAEDCKNYCTDNYLQCTAYAMTGDKCYTSQNTSFFIYTKSTNKNIDISYDTNRVTINLMPSKNNFGLVLAFEMALLAINQDLSSGVVFGRLSSNC